MKIILLIFAQILLINSINAQSSMIKIVAKFNTNASKQLHRINNNSWMSSNYSNCKIWKKKKSFFGKIYYKKTTEIDLRGYTKGNLELQNNTEIYGGYFTYNFKTKEFSHQSDLVSKIKEAHSRKLINNRLGYEIVNCVFDKKKERLILHIRYRPTRKVYRSNKTKYKTPTIEGGIPRKLVGFIDLKKDSVIRLLAKNELFAPKFLSFTKDYMVGLCKTIQVWNTNDGDLIKSLPYPRATINHISTEKSTNNLLITFRNGSVQYYNIEQDSISIIKTEGTKVNKSIPLVDGELYLILQEDKQCLIYQKTTTDYREVTRFKVDDMVNDALYYPSEKRLVILTERELIVYDFGISRF